MTTPERGLFEQLISRLHAAAIVMANLPEVPGYNGSILQLDDIEAGEIAQTLDNAADELEKMEQQLAEAESNNVIEVDGLRVGECTVRAYREQIKIAEEQIAQLRARCGELESGSFTDDLLEHAICKWLFNRKYPDGDHDPETIVWTGGPQPEPWGPAYLYEFLSDARDLIWVIKDEDKNHKEEIATPQPAQQDECTRAGKHDWGSITGGMSCYKCGTPWWANTPEPKPAQEQKP